MTTIAAKMGALLEVQLEAAAATVQVAMAAVLEVKRRDRTCGSSGEQRVTQGLLKNALLPWRQTVLPCLTL